MYFVSYVSNFFFLLCRLPLVFCSAVPAISHSSPVQLTDVRCCYAAKRRSEITHFLHSIQHVFEHNRNVIKHSHEVDGVLITVIRAPVKSNRSLFWARRCINNTIKITDNCVKKIHRRSLIGYTRVRRDEAIKILQIYVTVTVLVVLLPLRTVSPW